VRRFAAYAPVAALALSTHVASHPPGVTATLTQAGGQSATKRIVTRFPSAFTYNPAFAVDGCEPADEQAATCPEASRLGTVEARSPFGEAEGPVHLTSDLRLVGFLGAYAGLVQVRFTGRITVADDGSPVLAFDDLPNIPASFSRISLEGGSKSLFVNPRRCGTYAVHADLESHASEHVGADLPLRIDGCPTAVAIRRPRVVRGVLRWRTSEPAVTGVVLLRGGARIASRRTGGGAWRLPRLREGRYRAILRARTDDGRVSPARTVRFRAP
jgi:hypothetical protein